MENNLKRKGKKKHFNKDFSRYKIVFNTVNDNGEFITLNQFKLFDNDSIKMYLNIVANDKILAHTHGIRFYLAKNKTSNTSIGLRTIYIQLRNTALTKGFIENQLDIIRLAMYEKYENGVPYMLYDYIRKEDKYILDYINDCLMLGNPIN